MIELSYRVRCPLPFRFPLGVTPSQWFVEQVTLRPWTIVLAVPGADYLIGIHIGDYMYLDARIGRGMRNWRGVQVVLDDGRDFVDGIP